MKKRYIKNPIGFEMVSKKDSTCDQRSGGCGRKILAGKDKITLVKEQGPTTPFNTWLCSDCAYKHIHPFSMWEDDAFTSPLFLKGTTKHLRYKTEKEAIDIVKKAKTLKNIDIYYKNELPELDPSYVPPGMFNNEGVRTDFPNLEPGMHKPCYRMDGTPKFGPDFKPSIFQNAIREEILKGTTHLVIDAKAGSGKTSTLEWVLCTTRSKNSIFLAFNRNIQRELRDRLLGIPGVSVSGLNGLGHQTVIRYLKSREEIDTNKINPERDQHKIAQIVDEMFPSDETIEPTTRARNSNIATPLKQLVDLVRCTLSDDYSFLVDRYHIEVEDAQNLLPEIYAAVPEVLRRDIGLAHQGKIDFNDQIWLPHALNLQPKAFDTILIDETQDVNKAQMELCLKAASNRGRIIAIGDKFQAIYGFRGSDSDSIPNLISTLKGTSRGCKVLPLSISYRCPKKVIELAQRGKDGLGLVPDIQAAPNAKEGEVIIDPPMPYEQFLNSFKPGDDRLTEKGAVKVMVICPMNAPLVAPAFGLIRRGFKATIIGRDIGKGLISLINKINGKVNKDIVSFIFKLQAYEVKEIKKLKQAGRATQHVEDKIDTIMAMSDGVTSIDELKEKIKSIFSDEEDAKEKKEDGIIFSTVHKAKGLEAMTVFILTPEMLPFPQANEEWEIQQGKNLAYVAYTRSMDKLIFVRTPKDDKEMPYRETHKIVPNLEALPPETPSDMGLWTLYKDAEFITPFLLQDKPVVAESEKKANKMAEKIKALYLEKKNKQVEVFIKPPTSPTKAQRRKRNK